VEKVAYLPVRDKGQKVHDVMQIPPMGFVPIKEPKYYFMEPGQEEVPKDMKGQDLYYGEFYAKLVSTKNKIEQYNEMVYGSPAGKSDTKRKLQGVPNKQFKQLLIEAERKNLTTV